MMTKNGLLSVLHLSDFHYSKRKLREQEIVVDALIADLEVLCIGHRRPDIVYFTGDLVQAAGIDGHDDAYDLLLSRVVAATGCSEERIFLLPGNHDIERSAVEKHADRHVEWRKGVNNSGIMNALYASGEFNDIIAKKFSAFLELSEYMNGSSLVFRNPFGTVHRLPALSIDIVSINTAGLSLGGLPDHPRDESLLAVPEYAIREIIKHVDNKNFVILGTHHPLKALSDQSSRFLSTTIQRVADIHLFGHMHDPVSSAVTGFEGELFSDQAGAIFTNRKDSYIGYSLVCIDREGRHYENHLRTYFPDRNAFDDAIDIIPKGKFYSSQPAREFWRNIATPVDEAKFRETLATACLKGLEASLARNEVERSAHELFVAPPLERVATHLAPGRDEASAERETVSFEQLVRSNDNVIIMGGSQYGKTSVLMEAQYSMLYTAREIPFPRIPIVIEFDDIKYNADQLLKTAASRSLCPASEYDTESLFKLGYVCLLCDDVRFDDPKRMSALRAFVARFPKARYIFSMPRGSAAPQGARIAPEMPVHFDVLELGMLRRQDMRALIAKRNNGCDVDLVLDRIQEEIGEINIPFTAANGTIFMVIFEEQSNFRPINRSVLIEQFVDITLRKAAVEESQRETFDYKNKTALLAHVAGWMAENDQYVVTEDDLRASIRDYLNRVGLNADVSRLLREFLTARIMVTRPDGRYSFRYRAVTEYFVAQRMAESSDFRDWVLDDSRYLSYSNEIQYFAGRGRENEALIREVEERFDKFVIELIAEIGPVEIASIQTLKLPAKSEGQDALDHLSEQLEAGPLTAEEKDQELNAEIPRDVEDRQEVFRPKIEHAGHKFILLVLLYSGLLKNLELIPDAEKRRHLQKIWHGWALFLHLSLQLAPELARQRRIRINGVLYEVTAPLSLSEAAVARNIALNMPVGITNWIAATLGTEKLERQLTEPDLGTSGEPMLFEFFRSSLIADLRLPAAENALRTAFKHLEPSSYLTEAMVWKLAELRRYDKLPQEAFSALMPTVGTALASLRGGDHKVRADEKRKQIARLKRDAILLKLKKARSVD